MRQMMSGELSPTLISAIVMGCAKKETIGEIAAAAQMREFATRWTPDHANCRHLRQLAGQRSHLQHPDSCGFLRPRPGPRSPHGGRSVFAVRQR